jgi:hypothetical protein
MVSEFSYHLTHINLGVLYIAVGDVKTCLLSFYPVFHACSVEISFNLHLQML